MESCCPNNFRIKLNRAETKLKNNKKRFKIFILKNSKNSIKARFFKK